MPGSVSIVIPTFNCGRYIGDTLDSVFAQTRPAAEVIVVDDGSTDDTASIVAGFGLRVRYMFHENAGVSHARNKGLLLAQSAWVMFLDADDTIHPDGLALLVDASLGRHAGVIYGDKHTITEAGVAVAYVENRDCTGPVPSAARASFNGAAFEPGAAIVSRSLAITVGGFNQIYTPCEDRDFWIRCGLFAEFHHVPHGVLNYRIRPGSLSKNRVRHVTGAVRVRLDALRWFHEQNVTVFDDAPDPASILSADLMSVYWTREWDVVDALLALADNLRLDNREIASVRERRRIPGWILRAKDVIDRNRK